MEHQEFPGTMLRVGDTVDSKHGSVPAWGRLQPCQEDGHQSVTTQGNVPQLSRGCERKAMGLRGMCVSWGEEQKQTPLHK